jgi:hypothetical protein
MSFTMNRLVLSSASFILLLAWPAAAATLQAHRAFYDLEVKRMEAGNNISSVTGKLAYEITGSACEGYAINYRIANRIVYAEGGPQVIDSQMTSWESGDGLELDLTQKQYVDSKLNSESRIKVKKASESAPGKGLVTTAETKEFETTPAAIFPTRYQAKLIDAAVKGETRDVSTVYEGSEEEKSMRAISFIGPKRPAAGLPERDAGDLLSMAAWPVSISYYAEQAQDDEQPLYQASFLMLENGISTDLTLDYGSYSLSGKLTKLELLKSDTCP